MGPLQPRTPLNQYLFQYAKRIYKDDKDKIKESNQKNESCEEKIEIMESFMETFGIVANTSDWFHPESMLCAKGEGVDASCYVSIKKQINYSLFRYTTGILDDP